MSGTNERQYGKRGGRLMLMLHCKHTAYFSLGWIGRTMKPLPPNLVGVPTRRCLCPGPLCLAEIIGWLWIWQCWPIIFPTLTSQLRVGIQLPGNSKTWEKESWTSSADFARLPILRGHSRLSGILADGAALCSTATPEIPMF